MSADALIREAQEAGVALRMVGGKLKAASELSVVQSWARRLLEHKSELIEALAANDLNPPPEPVADTADWRELAAAYHAHHSNCPTCIAAERGNRCGQRCGAGMTLWRLYCD